MIRRRWNGARSHRPWPESNDRRFEYDARGGGYTTWVDRTLRGCLGEIDPPITSADSVKVLRVVHAAYASAESGSRVTL